jgi:hypothetical protein
MKHKLAILFLLIAALCVGVQQFAQTGAIATSLGAGLAILALGSVTVSLGMSPVIGVLTNASPNTGTSLAAMEPNAVRKLWQAGVDIMEQSTDFFTPMEGGGSALIHTITDTSKGKGQSISFTTRSGFYDEPHMGEELFETQDDFEEILIDEHDLSVDWIRHATRISERAEEVMGMRGEIESGDNEELGKWLGRLKTEQMFMCLMHKVNAENVVYAGGKTLDTLVSADALAWDEIVALGTQMKTKGGLPAYVGNTVNGNKLFKNLVVATTDALYSLETDTDYKQVLRETINEANAKLLFDGGYANVRGHVVKEYTPIDHDGEGAIGSPLNPLARLGVAITAGTGALTVYGGGNATSAAKTKKKYFKYFPGYAYRFTVADVLAPESETRYFLVVNPPNAATDPNKIGMYSYTTGNDGNKIALTGRLGSSAGGIRVTTLGSVEWNTGVWANKHTDVHPANAIIVPCNAKGVPVGSSLMLGRRAARRGYGKYRNLRTQETKEGGFITDRFITSVFGQGVRKDRQGRVPGVMVLKHAIQYAGLPIPAVS